MILADKIIRLRKQFGWSQEELAEKMNVSRQSVSKWESANSIPDLNKILKLAEIFGVSTDYLLKDEIEEVETINVDKEPGIIKLTLDEAMTYVEEKIKSARLTSIGVLLTITSVVPLILLLGMKGVERLNLTKTTAIAVGLVVLFLMVAVGVTFFIRSSQFYNGFLRFEEEDVELVYGVRSVIQEKLRSYRSTYTLMVSVSVMMFITSVVPLILAALMNGSQHIILMMLVVMLLIIAFGVFIIIPPSTRYNAYNLLIGEGDYAPSRKPGKKRAEKIASVYWPLFTAIYLGWSLWTMAWGITWIVWPVAGVAFAPLVGLAGMFDQKE